MNNRDVYEKDPGTNRLVNDGVANVNDDKTNQALAVLRHELDTFVCEGQYADGMLRILETYIDKIDQEQQSAVWVSGFFGSGKSHLVKMLRALWNDTVFEDGATARGTADLPQSINDCFKELMVQEATVKALQRLYPQFQTADHVGWPKVYQKARSGAPDALQAVGDEGEAAKNSVCQAVLGFIANGKSGVDIRTHFEAPPFGWSRDAVDGGLQVLLTAGLIRAQDPRGQVLDPRGLERKAVGQTMFKVEATPITAAQGIQIRKLLQKAGFTAKQGEERGSVQGFLEKMLTLASQAGGEVPLPEGPSISLLEDIRLTSGNEQLLAFYNNREELGASFDSWSRLAEAIEKRWPNWDKLKKLIAHASSLESAEAIRAQVEVIEQQRRLLDEPDAVAPLISSLTQMLREALNRLNESYQSSYAAGMKRLEEDSYWQQLEPEQRDRRLAEAQLTLAHQPKVAVQSTDEILGTLEQCSLPAFGDRVAALSGRFEGVITASAMICEPKVQFISVPRRTLKTEDEVDAWAEAVKKDLKAALLYGPVSIK